jgi:hypothetical protein
MATIEDSFIQLNLCCLKCGHGWDIDDYSEISTLAASRVAEEEPCPKCGAV